jgi:hypothetical protein
MIHSLARLKARQTRGGAWVQLFLNIGIITANVKLFESWYTTYGISIQSMLIACTFGYVAGTILIGYIDEKYGIWTSENEYNSQLNPITMGIQNSLSHIKEELDELKEKVKL